MSLSKNLLIRSRRRCYWCKNYTCTCILQIDQHSNANITHDFFPIRLISYYSRLCWRPILATAVWDINTRRRHVIVKKSVCKQLWQSILVQKLCILHSAQLQTYLGFVSTTIWILLMLFSMLVRSLVHEPMVLLLCLTSSFNHSHVKKYSLKAINRFYAKVVF